MFYLDHATKIYYALPQLFNTSAFLNELYGNEIILSHELVKEFTRSASPGSPTKPPSDILNAHDELSVMRKLKNVYDKKLCS